jgi:DNA-binding Lrp family transcriptional regulator
MKAYVLTKIRTGEIGETLRQLLAVKGVAHADMTFGPYDAVITVEARDLNALGRLIAWDIQTIPGVAETLTCLAVEPV